MYIRWIPWGIFCLALLVSCEQTNTDTDASKQAARPDSITDVSRIAALTKQIESNPEDYALFQDRSELYYQIDSLDRAIADIEAAIALYQTGPDLHYWRGFLAFTSGDTLQARTAYQRAIDLGTQNSEAYYQLGQVAFFNQNYGEAQQLYARAAEFAPEQPIYIFAQGFLLEAQQDYKGATKQYLDALALDSTFAKPLTRLHDIYLDFYENERVAMKYNAQLIRNQPLHPLGRYQLGNYHLRNALRARNSENATLFGEEINLAVESYTLSINRDPQYALARYFRGYAYFLAEQRVDLAIADMEEALKLDPTMGSAYFVLGSIYEYNGDLQSAKNYYEQAVKYQPDSKDFQQALREVQAQLK
ncbi:MAG: tetratricopeptide repeat protein [Bacteroidota bacterium]